MKIIIRKDNEIINIITDGKVPIRGKTSNNLYFHTPLELLLSALGLCVAGEIKNYCRMNEISQDRFGVIDTYYDGHYKVIIETDELLDTNEKNMLNYRLSNCSIRKELKTEVEIIFHNKPVERTTNKPRKCCGE